MPANNIHAVILAGGSGTRFWPMSRQNRPKQFLNLIGKGSLLQQTLERILPALPAQNIWIVVNRRYRKEIRRQLAGFKLKAAQILWEPEGKNTAPAIAWAATRIHALDPAAITAVLPSDHLITDPGKFLHLLTRAVQCARQDYLVTFGIVPTRPETGYGYLQTRKDRDILRVIKFIEKPDFGRAKEFVAQKNYFWNSGMFVWKVETILEAFKRHLPVIHARRYDFPGNWSLLPSISIDYGILEKADNVAAIPAAGLGWSDLGSWESLAETLPRDEFGNTLKGNALTLDCRNSLIVGDKRLVAVIGLKDMIVIDTSDALLVCPKHLSQDVKKLVETLKKRGLRVC